MVLVSSMVRIMSAMVPAASEGVVATHGQMSVGVDQARQGVSARQRFGQPTWARVTHQDPALIAVWEQNPLKHPAHASNANNRHREASMLLQPRCSGSHGLSGNLGSGPGSEDLAWTVSCVRA